MAIKDIADKESVQELVKRAVAAQQKFEVAPELFVAEQRTDLLTEIAKKYVPEAYTKRPTKHCYWCKEDRLREYATRGYEPFIEHGDMVRLNELVLTTVPYKLHITRERAFQAESRKKVAEMDKATVPNTKVVGGDSVDMRNITVEKSTVETRQVTSPPGDESGG